MACLLQIDADPDPSYHVDADADADPSYHFDADPDPAYHFDADTDADPDPNFQFDADPDPQHCPQWQVNLSVSFCFTSFHNMRPLPLRVISCVDF